MLRKKYSVQAAPYEDAVEQAGARMKAATARLVLEATSYAWGRGGRSSLKIARDAFDAIYRDYGEIMRNAQTLRAFKCPWEKEE